MKHLFHFDRYQVSRFVYDEQLKSEQSPESAKAAEQLSELERSKLWREALKTHLGQTDFQKKFDRKFGKYTQAEGGISPVGKEKSDMYKGVILRRRGSMLQYKVQKNDTVKSIAKKLSKIDTFEYN